MATTNNGLTNNGLAASMATLAANLGVPLEQLLAMATPAAPPAETAKPKPAATPAAPPAKPARVRKPKPVTATAGNGAQVDLTDPYRRMVAFTLQAIRVLRATDGKSKGIHSVYSGFNEAFGKHFGMAKEQVWSTVDLMTERGDIQSRFARGGKMLYLPGEMAENRRESADAVLAKILRAK